MVRGLSNAKGSQGLGETSESTRPNDEMRRDKGKGLMGSDELNEGSCIQWPLENRQEPLQGLNGRRAFEQEQVADLGRQFFHRRNGGNEEFRRDREEEFDDIPLGFARHGDFRRDCRTCSIEMPIFNGDDPDGWIYRVERFFFVGRFTEAEKMELVALSLEKEALAWFRWIEGRRPMRNWEEFKGLLVQKFRPMQEGTQCQRLLAVNQSGTIDDYVKKFVELAASLPDLPDSVLESTFINGLSGEIRMELPIVNPRSLHQMMTVAQ